MIGKLSGRVDSVEEDSAILDVGGVGYLVFASRRTLGTMVPGEPARLLIETHVREDHIHLYGFTDAAERDWFRLLTTVQGVGARNGLSILSVLTPGQLAQAIAAQDKAAVTRANGVGPKLAQRIVTELKDKAGGVALGGAALQPGVAAGMPAGLDGLSEDAVSALVNLGYRRVEAFSAVAKVAGKLDGEATLESLIRGGLRELAP
jgi:Holliday junction DNA helicase RuvA